MRAYVRDQRRSNWAWFQHAVMDDYLEPGRISATDFAIYCALCRFANSDGASWPSAVTLGRKAGVSDRTAQRAIQKLQDVGLIEVERRRDDYGRDLPSVYVLLEPSPEGDRISPYPVTHDAGRVTAAAPQGDRISPEQEPRELKPENKKARTLEELIAATEADARLAEEIERRRRAGFGR